MKPLILVVEDNPDILFTIQLSLESNDYRVETAKNGKDALKKLSKISKSPDIIISDIMMDEMDGYELFKELSNNPLWSNIPFVFLTARASPKDIIFGKKLGVDDYLTKPFKEEDLIAVISGKLSRKRKSESINKTFEELLKSRKIDLSPSISKDDMAKVVLLEVIWDDYIGPALKSYFPKEEKFLVSIKDVAQQLFQSAVSIYGHEDVTQAQGILINIENIRSNGYIFFDAYPDKTARAGERQYMLAVIAPSINYFKALDIKEIFEEISRIIKEKKAWDPEKYWKAIFNLLSSPSL